MCVHVVLALPSVLGVWSIAPVLWLPFECYLLTDNERCNVERDLNEEDDVRAIFLGLLRLPQTS